jgi:hypothetical protein
MANYQITKRRLVLYWIATGLLSFGMIAGGLAQIFHVKFNVDGIIHLGYPIYFLTIIGIWKILGVIVILIPGFLLIKEWAYAGLFFAMSGAVISHIVSGDTLLQYIAPAIFACLTVVSWYLRPPNRKLNFNVSSFQTI